MQKSDVVMYGDKPIAINVSAETTKTKQEAPLKCIDEDLEKLLTEALRADRSVWLFSNRLGKRGVADRVAAFEKTVLMAELQASGGSLRTVYERLGLSRKTLYEKMQKHGLKREDFTAD